MLSKHHPAGGASPHFDNVRLQSLIAAHQAGTDPAALAEIVTLTQDRALTLIRFRKTARYCAEDELLSNVNFKLLRAVDKFDPAKGTAFTFLSCIVQNTLCSSVTKARTAASRYVEFDEAVANKLTTNGETQSRDALEDLAHRIRSGVKTALSDPLEQDGQRWYVNSFINGAFELARHQCADAAMTVYGLSHSRSRELYDLSLVEIRRLMYYDLPPRPSIAPGRLLGTRAAWMVRYAPLMDESEFSKFFALVRDLAPFVILLVDPANRSRRQDRSAQVSRRNIEFILSGHPDAIPLFPQYVESMAAAADVSFDVLLGGKVTPQVLKAFKDLEELREAYHYLKRTARSFFALPTRLILKAPTGVKTANSGDQPTSRRWRKTK
jgi:DNA-directed RNA polymerase specialized sigma24 family protein